jgi:hypothetical protein
MCRFSASLLPPAAPVEPADLDLARELNWFDAIEFDDLCDPLAFGEPQLAVQVQGVLGGSGTAADVAPGAGDSSSASTLASAASGSGNSSSNLAALGASPQQPQAQPQQEQLEAAHAGMQATTTPAPPTAVPAIMLSPPPLMAAAPATVAFAAASMGPYAAAMMQQQTLMCGMPAAAMFASPTPLSPACLAPAADAGAAATTPGSGMHAALAGSTPDLQASGSSANTAAAGHATAHSGVRRPRSQRTPAEIEAAVERIKQKRRESAQRSRARKNDYMHQLELENQALREELGRMQQLLATQMQRGMIVAAAHPNATLVPLAM